MKLYKSANPDDYEVIEESQHVESITVNFTPITNTITKIISLSILISIPILLFMYSREYFMYIVILLFSYTAYMIASSKNSHNTIWDNLQVIRTKRPDLAQSIENLERVVRSIEKKSGERIV
jgi:hypothetical protein